METRLRPHPASPASAVESVGVTVQRRSAAALRLGYLVTGRIDQLVLPPIASPGRTYGLWEATCFEAFLSPELDHGYRELNFSPSSRWAAYEFSAYRSDMIEAALLTPPEIELVRESDRLAISVMLSLDLPHEPYRLGLSAVIEESDGRKSYWALSHHGETPDFHRRDCFTLELPPAA